MTDHRQREQRAITKFCSLFGPDTSKKLGENDVDFQVFKGERLVGFVEVKGQTSRHRLNAYPLPVAIRKLNKLQGELAPRTKPVLVWACHDGIIYGKIRQNPRQSSGSEVARRAKAQPTTKSLWPTSIHKNTYTMNHIEPRDIFNLIAVLVLNGILLYGLFRILCP